MVLMMKMVMKEKDRRGGAHRQAQPGRAEPGRAGPGRTKSQAGWGAGWGAPMARARVRVAVRWRLRVPFREKTEERAFGAQISAERGVRPGSWAERVLTPTGAKGTGGEPCHTGEEGARARDRGEGSALPLSPRKSSPSSSQGGFGRRQVLWTKSAPHVPPQGSQALGGTPGPPPGLGSGRPAPSGKGR